MKTVLGGIIFWQGKVLIAQRRHDKSQEYMWEFPGTVVERGEPEAALLQVMHSLGLSVEIIAPLGQVQHGYTNHRLTARFFRIAADPPLTMKEISARLGDLPHRFVPWNKTGDLAMPAHHRKMAERYFHSKPRKKAEQLPL